MKNSQFVSVIIPCYQEKDFIGPCLDCLVENSWSREKIEILVMDGNSTDGTREIVLGYARNYPFIKLKDNPGRFPSSGMNRGITESRGSIIIRCDAHARYEKDYILKLVKILATDASIGNAGGVLINKPYSDSCKARAIAYSMGSSFCVGLNRFRTGAGRAVFVDTVPFGAWRREVFDKIGFFNEEFLRAQDLELNMRLRKAGYKILLDPSIKIYYYPRENLKKLFRMMFQIGYWKNFVNKKLKAVSSARQFAPPVFVLYVFSSPFLWLLSSWFLAPAGIYLAACAGVSLNICLKKNNLKLFALCGIVFILSHFGYGAGYLKGFWDFFIRKKSSAGNLHTEITR